jgi:hypothetical protein
VQNNFEILSYFRISVSRTCPDVDNLVTKKQCLAACWLISAHKMKVSVVMFSESHAFVYTNVSFIQIMSTLLHVLLCLATANMYNVCMWGYEMPHFAAIKSLSMGILSHTRDKAAIVCSCLLIGLPALLIRAECWRRYARTERSLLFKPLICAVFACLICMSVGGHCNSRLEKIT